MGHASAPLPRLRPRLLSPPPAAQTPGTPASMSASSGQGAQDGVYPPVNLSG